MIDKNWDFDSWAATYDISVQKHSWIHEKYQEAIDFTVKKVENIAIKKQTKVLDIGAGTGNLCSRLNHNPNIILEAVEPSAKMRDVFIQKCENINIISGSLPVLPFSKNSFDILVATYVIHHIPPDLMKQTIEEFKRILKRPGFVVLVDVMFKSRKKLKQIKNKLKLTHNYEVVEEIDDEFFPIIDELCRALKKATFKTSISNLGFYTWFIYGEIVK